jgi:gamma-glutamyl:cysteine ligase YbdK (ATP-grasp superfamily)
MTTTLRNLLAKIVTDQYGQLDRTDGQQLAELDRLRQVLVRCNACRFTCAAQDLDHMTRAIAAVDDWIRDVSLPAGDPAHRGDYSNFTAAYHAQFSLQRTPARQVQQFREEELGGSFDGFHVTSDADPGL